MFEIIKYQVGKGKFSLVFFDQMEKVSEIILFEGIGAEEVGQLLGGN